MNEYNDITKVNDIALLRLDTTPYNLERRTEEGHPTRPVALCPESFDPQGQSCVVSGWGHLKSKVTQCSSFVGQYSVINNRVVGCLTC